MVKVLGKYLALYAFFIFALILFIPKESLYYFAEKQMQSYGVVISKESVEDKLFSLELRDALVSVKGVESANISKAEIILLIFYNKIEVEAIELSSVVDSFMPTKIDNIALVYTIVNPLHISATAEGTFGKAMIDFSILDAKVNVLLQPSSVMKSSYKRTLRYFKRNEKGEYIYEKAL